jgi:hypothetical protein
VDAATHEILITGAGAAWTIREIGGDVLFFGTNNISRWRNSAFETLFTESGVSFVWSAVNTYIFGSEVFFASATANSGILRYNGTAVTRVHSGGQNWYNFVQSDAPDAAIFTCSTTTALGCFGILRWTGTEFVRVVNEGTSFNVTVKDAGGRPLFVTTSINNARNTYAWTGSVMRSIPRWFAVASVINTAKGTILCSTTTGNAAICRWDGFDFSVAHDDEAAVYNWFGMRNGRLEAQSTNNIGILVFNDATGKFEADKSSRMFGGTLQADGRFRIIAATNISPQRICSMATGEYINTPNRQSHSAFYANAEYLLCTNVNARKFCIYIEL